MISADSNSKPMKLSEMLQEAGIAEYADWTKQVEVWPNGNQTFKPRRYQIEDVNHMAAYLPRMGLWSEPGVGKSLSMQAFALWLSGLGNKSVVIMPPGLVPQFYNSFHSQFPGHQPHVKVAMLFGERGARQKLIDHFNQSGWPDILLMSYETFRGKTKAPASSRVPKSVQAELDKLSPEASLKRRQEISEELRAKQKQEDKLYQYTPGATITAYNFRWQALKHLGYNMVICDEAHAVKKPSADIHQAVREFVEPWDDNTSNGLVLATGSPIKTNVEDAYGLINLLDPKRYGSARAFDAMHCELVPYLKFRKVQSYHNLDYLYAGLYAKGRRITKKDAFPDMPTRMVTEIPIELSKDHKALYKKLVEEQVLEIGDSMIDATKQQRMYQYVQQILLCPENFTDKVIKHNEILTAIDDVLDMLGDRKLLIFAWYQKSIAKLMQYYKDRNPVYINGTVTGPAREKAKQTFINDPNCQILIAQVESGGVGLDGFQHVCSYAVFAEIYGHPGGFEQAVGRLERSGQTETVNVYLMVPRGTIAVKLRNDLCRKEGYANEAVRDKKVLISDMLGEEGFQGQVI